MGEGGNGGLQYNTLSAHCIIVFLFANGDH